MCGRYYIDIDMKEIKRIIEEAEKNIYDESRIGEIFPSNIAPIYIQDEQAMKPILAKWGFPKWDNKGLIINARAETLEEKFLFKNLLKTNRCTVPASAYFEWKEKGSGSKSKDKYIIKRPDKLMYFAGLYDIVPKQKQEQLSLFDTSEFDIYYTIITKKADTSVSHIHDRMPIIFEQNEIDDWLNGKSINEIVKNEIELTSELLKI
jgi:putative SOS response-associated peptidase YedK